MDSASPAPAATAPGAVDFSVYRTLFEGTGDSIFLMRGEQFVDCNPATLEMFGCRRDQIIGQPPYRFSPQFQPDGRPSQDKALEKIGAAFGGRTQHFEWLHCRHDGTPFDAEVTLNVVQLHGEPHLLAVVRDTSERKRAEAELAQSRRTLEQRNESLRLINHLSTGLHGALETDEILAIASAALRGMQPTPSVLVALCGHGQQEVRLASFAGEPGATASEALARALHAAALAHPPLHVRADVAAGGDDAKVLREVGFAAALACPLLYRERPLGSIALLYREPREFAGIERDAFVAIGNTVASALASAQHVDGLEYLAHHDSLTGLPNRMYLHREFEQMLAAPGASGNGAALLLLDLDRFQEINDTLGHPVGDRLLQQVGPRLTGAMGTADGVLCRLGGDEFALLLPGESDMDALRALAASLLEALRRPFLVDSMQLLVDASIGLARFPGDGEDSNALLRSADVAMYEAKRKGGGLAIYDRSLDQNSPERLGLIADLNQAIREDGLHLHYQPKRELRGNRVVGFEALLRWQHPRLGLLLPEAFLAQAELSETIHPLTDRVLELAVAQLADWRARGLPQAISVNLSVRNLIDDRCLHTIERLLAASGVDPARLELEITETALMHDPGQVAERLDRIAALGVRISVDDYGTGYSSLGYLHRLPIDSLKIDRLFVTDVCHGEHDAIIVRSTIALAHSLGLVVVAEGVEDAATEALLRTMGCDQVQGYWLSPPLPPEQLEPFLI